MILLTPTIAILLLKMSLKFIKTTLYTSWSIKNSLKATWETFCGFQLEKNNIEKCEKYAEYITVGLQDAFHLFRFIAGYDIKKQIFYTVPYGYRHVTNSTIIQLLVNVFGVEVGQATFESFMKISQKIAGLSFYELHVLVHKMAFDLYRFLPKNQQNEDQVVLDSLIQILSTSIQQFLVKMGLVEIYHDLAVYTISYCNLANLTNRVHQDVLDESLMEQKLDKFAFWFSNNY